MVESTSYIVNAVYPIETHLIQSGGDIKSVLKWFNDEGFDEHLLPSHLTVVGIERNDEFGTTGVLFKDSNTGKLILGFTGSNNEAEWLTDWGTNGTEVAVGLGRHYQAAFDIYETLRAKHGAPAIVTGHSQGGAYAQRVAIEYDVPMSTYGQPSFVATIDPKERKVG